MSSIPYGPELSNKSFSLLRERNHEDTPIGRHAFIHGYLYCLNMWPIEGGFFAFCKERKSSAEDPALFAAFLDGFQTAVSDYIVLDNDLVMQGHDKPVSSILKLDTIIGMTIRLIDDPNIDQAMTITDSNGAIKKGSYKDLIFRGYFLGVEDGYNRLFQKDELLEADVALLLNVISYNWDELANNRVTPDIPSIEKYQRMKGVIDRIRAPQRRDDFLTGLLDSFPPLDDTTQYAHLFTEEDILFLLQAKNDLASFGCLEKKLKPHFISGSKAESVLKERVREVASALIQSGEHREYLDYHLTPPAGIRDQVLREVQDALSFQFAEVTGHNVQCGRLGVVFSTATGIRILPQSVYGLKTGIPYDDLVSDRPLDPKTAKDFPNLAQQLKGALPRIRETAQSMSLGHLL